MEAIRAQVWRNPVYANHMRPHAIPSATAAAITIGSHSSPDLDTDNANWGDKCAVSSGRVRNGRVIRLEPRRARRP